MPKVRRKSFGYESEKESFEVYGARQYKEKCRDYEETWTEEVTELLIYDGSWYWVDAKNYEPA
jgi:hypothetical protein